MRVIGLDLGSRQSGLCVLERENGTVRLVHEETVAVGGTKEGLPVRLLRVCKAVRILLERFAPQMAILETPFYGVDVRALVVLSQVRGAALVALAECEVRIVDLDPRTVKQVVTGYGNAPKDQVARMMQQYLGVSAFSSPDASDAAAVAYAGLWVEHQKHAYLEGGA